MERRFISIWFRNLNTDWFTLTQPHLATVPFVLTTSSKGKVVVTSANHLALAAGIVPSMSLADARAITPSLERQDEQPELPAKLLSRLAEWCLRFTPHVSTDLPDGLILDVTGCSHLWGGDVPYLDTIIKRIKLRGYDIQVAMADTIGAAWAIARYSKSCVVSEGMHGEILKNLPPQALRIDREIVERLHKLGLHFIGQFSSISRSTLRRRFGNELLTRMDQIFGREEESFVPLFPPEPYQERLPCMEPIVTGTGIEIALTTLLKKLCYRLEQEHKGVRKINFKAYRVDGKIEEVRVETSKSTHNLKHLFKLFLTKLQSIEPALGIELFILEISRVEDCYPVQEKIWEGSGGLHDVRLAELIDRLGSRFGLQSIHRYIPAEHYWPERSYKLATGLTEEPAHSWKENLARPLYLLGKPQVILVTAPIPDYPPMLFRYKGVLHKITKADGPERIEQEWWLQEGQHRDYYYVEDESGCRYWLFRLGHYDDPSFQWFIHGYFA